jgi:hypothetical protein
MAKEDGFTPIEMAAIQYLKKALSYWPESLALLSLEGSLLVIHESDRLAIAVNRENLFDVPRASVPGVATSYW